MQFRIYFINISLRIKEAGVRILQLWPNIKCKALLRHYHCGLSGLPQVLVKVVREHPQAETQETIWRELYRGNLQDRHRGYEYGTDSISYTWTFLKFKIISVHKHI